MITEEEVGSPTEEPTGKRNKRNPQFWLEHPPQPAYPIMVMWWVLIAQEANDLTRFKV
jgi:hypothetical protein